MQRISMIIAGGGLLMAMATAGWLYQPKTRAVANPTRLASTNFPPTLSRTVGLPPLNGLTLERSGSTPLWANKSGTGPFTPSQLGLVGGLYQIWTSSAAVTQYGSLGHGLPLPLPASFVHAHPGRPLEVYVRILRFNNAKAPVTLLQNADYNFRLPVYKNRVTPIPGTIAGGSAYAMPNQDNNGETDYVFQWARGDYWNQITVLGPISGSQARSVAVHVTQ